MARTCKRTKPCLGWFSDGDGLVVKTDRGRYRAGRLVVTTGAWAPQLLASLGVDFRVLRKPLLWYRTQTPHYRLDNGFPVWVVESPLGDIYGFPEIDDLGFKLAEHSGGTEVADPLQAGSRPVGRGSPSARSPSSATTFPA